MLKYILIFFFIVLPIMGGTLAFYFTKDITSTADIFLENIQKGDLDSAYSAFSPDGKELISPEGFSHFLYITYLESANEYSWNSRSVENGVGTIVGVVNTDGGKIPVEFGLSKDSSENWKIDYIHAKWSRPVPPLAEVSQLVSDTTISFADAVAKKDLSSFYQKNMSRSFKAQFSSNDFERLFHQFYEHYAFSTIKKVIPEFYEAPSFNKGLLVVQGYCPVEPVESNGMIINKLKFEYEYIHDKSGWKLLSIEVRSIGKKLTDVNSDELI